MSPLPSRLAAMAAPLLLAFLLLAVPAHARGGDGPAPAADPPPAAAPDAEPQPEGEPGAAPAPSPAPDEDAEAGREEDEAADPAAGDEDASRPLSADDLQARIEAAPELILYSLLVQWIPLLLGLALIVWYVARSREPGAGPPDLRRPPRALFSPGIVLALVAGGALLGPMVVSQLLAPDGDLRKLEPIHQIVAVAIPGLLVAGFVLARTRGRAHPEALRGRAVLVAALAGYCLAQFFTFPAAVIWKLVLDGIGHVAEVQEPVQWIVEGEGGSLPVAMTLLAVFGAPLWEEVIFRGLLFPTLRDGLGGGPKAVLASAAIVSALFAAVHMSLLAMIPLFLLAMLLSYLYQRTASLWICILVHALFNASSTGLLLLLRNAGGAS